MDQLSIDLANVLPVESTRFIPNQETQNYENNNKILIAIGIRQQNGETITKDLNTLIRNKNITMISHLESTNLLDEEFGCIIQSRSDLIYKFKELNNNHVCYYFLLESVAGNFKLEVGIFGGFFGVLLLINIFTLCFKVTKLNFYKLYFV
jgi:hypothetical protein